MKPSLLWVFGTPKLKSRIESRTWITKAEKSGHIMSHLHSFLELESCNFNSFSLMCFLSLLGSSSLFMHRLMKPHWGYQIRQNSGCSCRTQHQSPKLIILKPAVPIPDNLKQSWKGCFFCFISGDSWTAIDFLKDKFPSETLKVLGNFHALKTPYATWIKWIHLKNAWIHEL